MTMRAFIAVELDDELRREVARVQEKLRAALDEVGAKIAWVRPASMHLTLKFLGDIEETVVPALHDAIATAIHDRDAIAIPLCRLGAFPRLKEPRNLWLGPDEQWPHTDDARRLQSLARVVDGCCAEIGIAPEARVFSPHLTLGRVKAGERQLGRALAGAKSVTEPLHLPPLNAAAVTLMKSQLDTKGAVHTPQWKIPLRPNSSA